MLASTISVSPFTNFLKTTGRKTASLQHNRKLDSSFKSNLIFIVVDDLNDWISPLNGFYGSVLTPNFERLAKRSTTFHHAYCNVPWCDPSRAATLTGLSPNRTRFYGQTTNLRDFPILSEAESIFSVLKKNGYFTIGGGKIFHGYYEYGSNIKADYNDSGQSREAWDEYFHFPREPRPESGPNNGLKIPFGNFDWSKEFNPPENLMPDKILAQWGARQLSQSRATPFCLALGFYRPHLPWYVPKQFFDLYPIDQIKLPDYLLKGDLSQLPPFAQKFAENFSDQRNIDSVDDSQHTIWRKGIQAYLASLSFVDYCLGLVLDGLDEGPNAKNTTIVLWSDNGFQLGEKRSWRKFKLWEKATRVPMFISLPQQSDQQACSHPVSLLDIFPTITELLMHHIPKFCDGRSLVPLLKDPPHHHWLGEAITTFSEQNDGSNLHRTIRTRDYRYILYADGSEELYDHRSDKQELRNLLFHSSVEMRTLADHLRARLLKNEIRHF